MRRSPILFLLISLSTLLVTSCAVKTVHGYVKTPAVSQNYTAGYFSDTGTDYVYKANVAVYGREFGGIFIVKKTGAGTHRAVFTTEFGNKLFDFEISGNSFKVNYILGELNRKMIVNTLKKDFMILLKEAHHIDEQYQKGELAVYRSKSGSRHNYLFIDEQERLVKLVHATKAKEKIVFTYEPASDTLAQNITIAHKDIKLTIQLSNINN